MTSAQSRPSVRSNSFSSRNGSVDGFGSPIPGLNAGSTNSSFCTVQANPASVFQSPPAIFVPRDLCGMATAPAGVSKSLHFLGETIDDIDELLEPVDYRRRKFDIVRDKTILQKYSDFRLHDLESSNRRIYRPIKQYCDFFERRRGKARYWINQIDEHFLALHRRRLDELPEMETTLEERHRRERDELEDYKNKVREEIEKPEIIRQAIEDIERDSSDQTQHGNNYFQYLYSVAQEEIDRRELAGDTFGREELLVKVSELLPGRRKGDRLTLPLIHSLSRDVIKDVATQCFTLGMGYNCNVPKCTRGLLKFCMGSSTLKMVEHRRAFFAVALGYSLDEMRQGGFLDDSLLDRLKRELPEFGRMLTADQWSEEAAVTGENTATPATNRKQSTMVANLTDEVLAAMATFSDEEALALVQSIRDRRAVNSNHS